MPSGTQRIGKFITKQKPPRSAQSDRLKNFRSEMQASEGQHYNTGVKIEK